MQKQNSCLPVKHVACTACEHFSCEMCEASNTLHSEWQKAEFGIKKYLKGGDSKSAGKNWKMLYCGGLQPVLDQIKDFKRKFGVGLSVENFDWQMVGLNTSFCFF